MGWKRGGSRGKRVKGGKQAAEMEEQLEGVCKTGVGDSAATCRRVSRIDSKIYDVRRKRGEEAELSRERGEITLRIMPQLRIS